MGQKLHKLTALQVKTLKAPGLHSDGGGLYLVVDTSGARRWLFVFRWQSKRKEMGLGGLRGTTLAGARDKAAAARASVSAGINPIDARKANAARKAPKTFGESADELLRSIVPGFKNVRHRAQWKRALEHYALPIRGKALQDVETADILRILQPLWQTKQETASRVRGRIERVLDAAKAKGEIASPWENPARWRGHLQTLLSQRTKLARGHHAAMPYADVPTFVAKLRLRDATAAAALDFAILNASRANEALGARWEEFNLDSRVWTIPRERMKNGKPHRVPLSTSAVSIVERQKRTKISDFVFPGQKTDKPLSGMAMEMLLRRMGASEFTQHGFRSSFRDWCGERTNFPRELAEAALSHSVGDETQRAYRRGDALERRRKLMEAWCQFLSKPSAPLTSQPVSPAASTLPSESATRFGRAGK
ncbi:site-specific integrase [Bosea sp. UNC402CLCol]|uniref:tyrosine-type recombinase/integrase n=1 Tax=Bosea sp. UNC402CLCol TaxID=1510531 RepID=UPI0009DECCEA|nr:site-specific integrase [Bosea sp. UNC402CLCol]